MKPAGMICVGLIVVIMVCVKQTFAAALEPIQIALSDIPTSPDLDIYYPWVYEGEDDGDEVGLSVHGAGDLNGDGFEDIIIGAPVDGDEQQGTAFVFYGRSQRLSMDPGWSMDGSDQGYRFGSAVSSAGDVNGDGYDDIIIGSEDHKVDFGTSGIPKSGAVFVYRGSGEGLGDAHSWYVLAEAREISLGFAVSDAGDVNSDGYDDVIVAAPGFESQPDHSNEGKVYLYLGSAEGLSTDAIWTYECDQAGATCGYSVGSAGDVNGDGFADVIIGARNYESEFSQEGAAFVFYGSTEGLSTEPAWTITGGQEGAKLGTSVAGAGDVNGDGLDDVIIGAPGFSHEGAVVGGAFVFHGSPGGLGSEADWESFVPEGPEGVEEGSLYGFSVHSAGDIDQDGFAEVIIGAYLFGEPGSDVNQPYEGAAFMYKGSSGGLENYPNLMVSGDKADAWLGYSVGSAGDVNGDSFDDVIIGAPIFRDAQRTKLGAAFVYYAQEKPKEHKIYLPFLALQN